MCGITGYIGHAPLDHEKISQALNLMKNRGPDDRNYVAINHNGNHIFLLHTRLSIIDLDERANQPFTIDDYTLIYNGEIYNYLELRQALLRRGISLRTTSDTEVLLHYYILYGEACVQYFEGMWSFALYDQKQGKLFLSRDRFAEKPLYYFRTSDGFYFGSEVKFLRALSGANLTINKQHLLRYLVNGYKSLYKTDETFFEEIQELPYASNAVIDEGLKLHRYQYWAPTYTPQNMSPAEAIDGIRHHLLESIKIRLRADVPLAFCLSGGVDSSAIVSIAAKQFGYDVATFSIIDQDERYNEYDNIRATIDDLACKHTIINIPQGQLFPRLEKLIAYHDAPLYTISYYVHSFLSEAIAQQGYRVVCSGTAADELVTGYYDHFNLHLYEMRCHPQYERYLHDWEVNIGRVVRNPYLQNPELYFDQPEFRGHIYLNNDVFAGYLKEDFSEAFVETHYCDSLLRNRMLNELFHEAIPVILHEDDLNSMLFSIENRSPYLDSRLFNFAFSVPNEHLIQNGYGKYVLREAIKGILNDKVRTDRRKKGFNASLNSAVDFTQTENRDYVLNDGPIYDWVHKDKIEDILKINPLPNSYSKFLFNLINAKVFLELNK